MKESLHKRAEKKREKKEQFLLSLTDNQYCHFEKKCVNY